MALLNQLVSAVATLGEGPESGSAVAVGFEQIQQEHYANTIRLSCNWEQTSFLNPSLPN